MPTEFLYLIGIVIGWLVCALAGVYVAAAKNRSSAEGIIFATFLGPLGVLIVALLPAIPDADDSRGRRRGEGTSRALRTPPPDEHPAIDDFLSEMKGTRPKA